MSNQKTDKGFVIVSISMTNDELKDLNDVCKGLGRNRSRVIRQAVRLLHDKLNKNKDGNKS